MTENKSDQADIETIECDLLVAGSGAAGMTAAIVARKQGKLKVIVAEKEPVFGGTTALSGGYLWIPNNPLSQAAGIKDSADTARSYIRHEAGNHFDKKRVDAFLRDGPHMVTFMHEHTAVRFEASPAFSDYHPDAPGGLPGGRSILTQPTDASILGQDLAKLRPPRPELTLYGLAIGSGKELWHFYRATKRVGSFAYVAKRLAKHGLDVALHGRGMLLTNGNALAARLYRTAKDSDIPVWLDCSPSAPLRQTEGLPEGRISGSS